MQEIFQAQIVYLGMPDEDTRVSMAAFSESADGDHGSFFVMNDDESDEIYNVLYNERCWYGGIVSCTVSAGKLEVRLDDEAHEMLQAPKEFVISFQEEYSDAVYRELEYLFSQSSPKPKLMMG